MKITTRHLELVLAPLCGVLATLAFAPYDLKPLALVALAGLYALLARTPRLGRSALIAWLFLAAHYLSGVYWIYISTHIYGGAPAWLGLLLCVTLTTVYMTLFPVLIFALAARRRGPWPALAWIAAPACWTLGEMCRGHLLWKGFAWLSLGDVALDTPLQNFMPMIGVHGVSLLIALMSYALYRLVVDRCRARLIAGAVLVAPVALALLLPAPGSWTQDLGPPMTAAIIQPNVPQEQKWLEEMQLPILQRHLDMTYAAMGADLIVWPEVSLTQPYHQLAPQVLPPLDARARAAHSALLAGMVIRDDATGGYHNSVLALGEASGRYYKRHLVPFGEYFPIPDFLRPLMDVLGTPYSDFLFGAEDQPPLSAKGQPVGAYICFEDVFGDEFRRRARGTVLSINVTNDAWFGHSSAAAQHLAMSRARSLETGRWTLRASNTGISALIDAAGVLREHSGFYTAETVSGSVQPRSGETPYMRWGDAPLWAFLLICTAGLLWLHRSSAPAK